MNKKLYAEREICELDFAGGHYYNHVAAMTSEKLYSKSDIAAELAYRDYVIWALTQQLECLGVDPDFEGYSVDKMTIGERDEEINYE